MNIVTLETGLFPDQDRVKTALDALDSDEHTITRFIAADIAADDDESWDLVVREIMKAGKVVTI